MKIITIILNRDYSGWINMKCASDEGLQKNMMVGFSSDTTNVIAGQFHSVFTN